jgi:hypothetical protein
VVESSRQQWDEGERRLAHEEADRDRARELRELVELVVDDLRRRLGSAYTVDELDELYLASGDWVRDTVEDGLATRPRVALGDAALVQDAAFAAYARGAVDYRP